MDASKAGRRSSALCLGTWMNPAIAPGRVAHQASEEYRIALHR